jgi:ABC-type lipoprotein export system ATPase subunit/bifunctional DNA-binding transcriptional regulator/antitoxin component of YhaV-PrlF toxin-antitoxin module
MAAETFILCENLVKIYRLEGGFGSSGESTEVQALQGLDLTVMRGEMVGVVGASGSGKSTLLNILGGLDRPTGGRAYVNKKDLGRLSQSELDHYRREIVGFVWQQGSRNLIPYLTAEENVRLPLMLSGRMDSNARQRPAELLRLVGLEDRARHRLEELSGGEQQRVAIAIALANQPRLLLADEPTGELDNTAAKTIYELLRTLNRTLGLTVVIVSHDSSLAQYVDRVVAVRDGKLASETVRKPGSSAKGGAHQQHHLEELSVLDSAGRLQIPREHLDRFHIRRRVRLEVTADGILIRPPEHEQEAAETPAHGASEPEVPEAPSDSADISGRMSVPMQLLEKAVSFLRRHDAREEEKKESQDGEA